MKIEEHTGYKGNQYARIFAFTDMDDDRRAPVSASAEVEGIFGPQDTEFTVNWFALGSCDTQTARKYVAAILTACDWVDARQAQFEKAKAVEPRADSR